MDDNRRLILSLLECDVLKIGNFKLKSGDFSPIYMDLRRIIHYPKVMKDIVAAIRRKQTKENLNTDTVCGVPYTAIPIASVFSTTFDIPMVMKRKEAKDYGTKRLIEGVFKAGDVCLLIEDVVCSGTSVKDTTDVLRREGLNVHDCIVVIDKEQGGIDNLKKVGLNVHSLFSIGNVFNVYCSVNRIESAIVHKVTDYLRDNPYMPIYEDKNYSALSYRERAEISNHPMAKRLLQIMDDKKTNLCISVDTNDSEELIKIVEQLGPHICLLKTHVDILDDFNENTANQLVSLASLHNFLILEDRKFLDIGKTVVQQYKKGIYKIEKWADLVTVYANFSSDTLQALKLSVNTNKRACILVSKITDAFIDEEHKEQLFQIADDHADFVIGYTARTKHPKNKNMICLCYSSNLWSSSNTSSNDYDELQDVIEKGADIIIVEIDAKIAGDVIVLAKECKTICFRSYLKRII